jgi:hypothetical protein
VLAYARELGVGFSVLPMLRAAHVAAELGHSPRYRALLGRIIELKRRGAPIMGTLPYLEGIRELGRFRCVPRLLLRVKPDGHLLYPCNKLEREAGSLIELGSAAAAEQHAIAQHGEPECVAARCHDSCYMDLSLCAARPSLLLQEGYYRVKGLLSRAVRP